MNERLYNSFNAGEISPELFTRGDTQLFRFGAAKLRNWVCQPSGAASLRPGFEYIGPTASGAKARLVPFAVEGDDYLLELTAGKTRVWKSGKLCGSNGDPSSVIECGDQGTINNVDFANNAIYSLDPHGLADEESVRVWTDGTFPSGIDKSFAYRARVVSPFCLTLEVFAGNPAAWQPVAIGSSGVLGTGNLYVIRNSLSESIPLEWAFPIVGTDPTALGIRATTYTTTGSPPWVTGQVVQFSTTGTGQANAAAQLAHDCPKLSRYPYDQTWPPPGNPTDYDGRDLFVYETPGSGAQQILLSVPIPPDDPYNRGYMPVHPWNTAKVAHQNGVAHVGRMYEEGTVVWHGLAQESGGRPNYTSYRANKRTTADAPNTYTRFNADFDAVAVPFLEFSNPFTEAELFEFTYAQTQNRVRFAHRNHRTFDLVLKDGTFIKENSLETNTAPPAPTVTTVFGQTIGVTGTSSGPPRINTATHHGLAPGELVYYSLNTGAVANKFYTCGECETDQIKGLMDLEGSAQTLSNFGSTSGLFVPAASTANTRTRYLITGVDAEGREFTRSETTAEVFNILANAEASNTISWDSIPGADTYRVYKEVDGTGLFGLLTKISSNRFIDYNIDPDYKTLAPEFDRSLESVYPGAVAFYDQRGVFAGTSDEPQTVWLSSTGQTRQMARRATQLDTDRIKAEIASLEGQSIRHVVPSNDLVILTDQSEWSLLTQNTDSLTPSSVSFRSQSAIGCSKARPVSVGSSILMAGVNNRVHRLNYQLAQNGLGGTDVSIRAAHLFTGSSVVDAAYTRARADVVWWVTSAGDLLGLTYSENEQITGWHKHTLTGCEVVSVAAVTEANEERLYAVISKGSSHEVVRLYADQGTSLTRSCYLDRSKKYDEGSSVNPPVSVQGGLAVGDTVSVISSSAAFAFNAVGQTLYFPTTGLAVEATGRTSATQLTGTVVTSAASLPVSDSNWGFAVNKATGLSHLSGEEVTILIRYLDRSRGANGYEVITRSVPSAGSVDLPGLVTLYQLGTGYENELRTMPVTLQLEASGLAKTKAISQVAAHVFESSGLKAGPSLSDATEVLSGFELTTGEQRELMLSAWTPDGQVSLSQHLPLPCTVIGVTLDVGLGG